MPMMKDMIYVGRRFGDKATREVSVGLIWENDPKHIVYAINPRYDLRKYAIACKVDFDWGPHCSPLSGKQLAIALCANSLAEYNKRIGNKDNPRMTEGDEIALRIYIKVYEDIIKKFTTDWSISKQELSSRIKAYK